jgi:hypothetical protein
LDTVLAEQVGFFFSAVVGLGHGDVLVSGNPDNGFEVTCLWAFAPVFRGMNHGSQGPAAIGFDNDPITGLKLQIQGVEMVMFPGVTEFKRNYFGHL